MLVILTTLKSLTVFFINNHGNKRTRILMFLKSGINLADLSAIGIIINLLGISFYYIPMKWITLTLISIIIYCFEVRFYTVKHSSRGLTQLTVAKECSYQSQRNIIILWRWQPPHCELVPGRDRSQRTCLILSAYPRIKMLF